MRVAPAASASSSCSRLCASISIGMSHCAARIRVHRRRDAAGQPDVVVLDQDAVVEASRWLVPPPARTAYFSSSRSPGVVLRVSSTTMRPAAAST